MSPLLFSTLVVGIAGTGDLRAMGRIGAKALIYFEVATTFALVLGLALVNLLRPGAGVQAEAGDATALQAIATKWDTLQAEDKRLKKAVADAKGAVEREKRNVALSIGQVEDVESLTGETVTRDIDVDLTIGGAPKPYTMTLRRYDLKGGSGGGRMMSRWVVQSITPKA